MSLLVAPRAIRRRVVYASGLANWQRPARFSLYMGNMSLRAEVILLLA